MLFLVLLITALSFIAEATPRCNNGYDPPGMEQTIVQSNILISLPTPVIPATTLQGTAQEVAFTSTGEVLQADLKSYNQMAGTYKLNKKIGSCRQIMPIYSMAY